ncbi:MAG TPA: hypothetical protein VNZ52_06800 [Candidatus Thermoplasmatota archaeon]|nr:hypothetical protein [Candidatus Thermoplasmatota archaeon]
MAGRRGGVLLLAILGAFAGGCIERAAENVLAPFDPEVEYTRAMRPLIDDMNEARAKLLRILEDYDAGRATPSDIVSGIAAARGVYREVRDSAAPVEAPPAFKEYHSALLDHLNLALEAFTLVEQCMVGLNESACTESEYVFRKATAALDRSNAAMPAEWRA